MATEDVVAMLHDMGIETGIDLDKLFSVDHYICEKLGKKTNSKVAALKGFTTNDKNTLATQSGNQTKRQPK